MIVSSQVVQSRGATRSYFYCLSVFLLPSQTPQSSFPLQLISHQISPTPSSCYGRSITSRTMVTQVLLNQMEWFIMHVKHVRLHKSAQIELPQNPILIYGGRERTELLAALARHYHYCNPLWMDDYAILLLEHTSNSWKGICRSFARFEVQNYGSSSEVCG